MAGPWTVVRSGCSPCSTASGRPAGRSCLRSGARPAWGDADGNVGPERLTWDLALELEAAEAVGEAVCGRLLTTSACRCWRRCWIELVSRHGRAGPSSQPTRRLAG
eukprot:9000583-Alexandrium_andersonii.AAC.1